MATRNRHRDEARRRWAWLAKRIGDELRAARHLKGVTLAMLGAQIGVSKSELSRRELGRSTRLTGEKLAIHAAAVGLKLSITLWPIGGGVRDAAQARYIAAFLARVGRWWKVALEVVLPIPGDL